MAAPMLAPTSNDNLGQGVPMTSTNWKRENLAWMAGLFEGEGYVQGRPKTYTRKDGRAFTSVGFRLAISMTDEDIMRRFHSLAGVGRLNGPRLSPSMARKNMKPLWDFCANGAEGYALMIALLPWLGGRRREQVAQAIQAWLQAPGHWSKKQIKR